jgi:ActR/RegA family two-component response regulator
MRTIEIAGSQSKLQRILLACLGIGLVLCGIIGLFLPIAPGLFLLAAGAVLLSRECPPLHRALEKCQARFPIVRRCLAGMPKLYATWRRRFPGKTRDSATTLRILNTSTPRQKNIQMSGLGCERKKNLDTVRSGLKILVFDQNLEDLTWHAEPFETRGFEVYKCTSIEAALRCIEREEFDFALVDQVSTAFEGLRVIRHLVRYNLHTSFIVLARHHDVPCYQQALSLGAMDYVQKPVLATDMNWMIDRYFGISSSEQNYGERRDVDGAEGQGNLPLQTS